jgi:hypothetical protein
LCTLLLDLTSESGFATGGGGGGGGCGDDKDNDNNDDSAHNDNGNNNGKTNRSYCLHMLQSNPSTHLEWIRK